MQSCTAKFSACIALLAAVTGFAPGHARTGPGLQPPCRSAPGRGLHSAGPRGWVTPGGCAPSACPTAAPQPPWPAGSPPSRRGRARQLSQATSQLLLSVRGDLRGARHGPRGPWARGGPSLGSGTEGGRTGSEGSGVRGPGAICSSPARVPAGRGPARAGTSTAGNGRGAAAGPSPVELGSVGGAGAGLGIPPSPARGTSRWDGDRMGRGSVRTLSPPSCCPPARRAPAPLKGALRGPTAHGGAARGSAAENTGTSP